MIVLLLSCVSSASIAAMHKEPMVQLDETMLGEGVNVRNSYVDNGPEYRKLDDNEVSAIVGMPDHVKFFIARGITTRFLMMNNGIPCKKVIKKNCWVNNKFKIIPSTHLGQYQDYSVYITQLNKVQSSNYAQL